MKLVTIDIAPHGRPGLILGDEILDPGGAAWLFPLASWIPASVSDILAGGDEGLEILRRLAGTVQEAGNDARDALRESGALTSALETRLLAPVPRPGVVLSHGRSYRGHVGEMGGANAKLPEVPNGFLKNTNAIVGPGAPIVLPPQASGMVDFEGEISVVFGKPCHNVSRREAMNYVAGFTVINDVSARDWVENFRATRNPDLNRMGKQFPTFSPMGPCIATKDEVADWDNLHMVTRLNGTVMQDARTDDLIFSIPELIEYFSKWYPFMPGDVLTTGTPSGVGVARNPPVFMQDGDVVSITVDGVGTLSNPVSSAPRPPFGQVRR